MTRQAIHSDQAPAAIGPYSQATRAGDTIYLSGQTPIEPATGQLVEGDIAVQARRAFDNLAAVCAAAGGSFDEQLASSHVEALRPQVQPDFQAALVRLSDTWLVEGREEVTVLDGTKRSLWRIASTNPVELVAGMPADVSLYTDVPGATEVMVSTGGGNTSERLYGAWGAPVDATAVEKAVAQALR